MTSKTWLKEGRAALLLHGANYHRVKPVRTLTTNECLMNREMKLISRFLCPWHFVTPTRCVCACFDYKTNRTYEYNPIFTRLIPPISQPCMWCCVWQLLIESSMFWVHIIHRHLQHFQWQHFLSPNIFSIHKVLAIYVIYIIVAFISVRTTLDQNWRPLKQTLWFL